MAENLDVAALTAKPKAGPVAFLALGTNGSVHLTSRQSPVSSGQSVGPISSAREVSELDRVSFLL